MPRHQYLNHYECERCGTTWEDVWCAMCDDDCPSCGATMSPYESEDLDTLCDHPDCEEC